MSPTDHHIVISADTHCGADLRQYKPYLETKYHDDFESWAAIVEAQQQAQEKQFEGKSRSTRNVGVDGDPVLDADRNWSSDRRLAEQIGQRMGKHNHGRSGGAEGDLRPHSYPLVKYLRILTEPGPTRHYT